MHFVKPDGERRFDQAMRVCGPIKAGARIGVGLSGGGDSTALLLLLADWAAANNVGLAAVTIDHGLRKAAVAEANQAASLAASLGIPHDILRWQSWSGQGNLQASARFSLISDWAMQKGIEIIALGHTLDDQAETVLMRLLRGSGVDGLSGMASRRDMGGITWIRPLLDFRRDQLRRFLRQRSVGWCDDPSNENRAFDRVKARKALAELEKIGLTVEGVAATADRMKLASKALEFEAHRAALPITRVTVAGEVEFGAAEFATLPADIQNRLLAHALCWIGGSPYRPRLMALNAVVQAAKAGKRSTLAGCLVTPAKSGALRIGREAAAIAGLKTPLKALWDNRWRLTGPTRSPDFEVRMLGVNGLNSCGKWRETGLSRDSLLTSPAVWQGAELIAAPLAGWPEGWQAELEFGTDHFLAAVLSH